MNIIFHEDYYQVYDADPAAAPGRMEPILRELTRHPHYAFITPKPAERKDLVRAHSARHIERIQENETVYKIAALAAGGAMETANRAFAGEPGFACIRPPGHHASYDSCWGFCFFNNMAISLLALEAEEKIRSAFILDFDLHTGDGNLDILGRKPGYTILNPAAHKEKDYLQEVGQALAQPGDYDIVAASAGFDQYVHDWGGTLSTDAFREIGALLKEFSERRCQGRRYALLEGGYCYADLGLNVHAFCEGFR